MSKIEEVKQLEETTGTFIVAISVQGDNDIQIFENESEKYIFSKGYKKMKICKTKSEAEKTILKYRQDNYYYIVRETPKGLKIVRCEGIVTIAPIGTLAVCRKRKQAKKEYKRIKQLRESEIEALNKTA
ncbi:MAG: hypothetical protein K6B70_04025 [Clostridia bacterium]|nr:hypothetical protein [Clostridia bacterium]